MIPTVLELEAERYGRDARLPWPGEVVQATPTGDWPTIEGLPNLTRAQQRRAVTTPGAMTHRPSFGGGLLEALETLSADAQHVVRASRIRRSALLDPRIADAEVEIRAGAEAGLVEVLLRVTPRGEDEAQTVIVTPGV